MALAALTAVIGARPASTYAAVHWLSDTVAGALLGAATALALWCAAGTVTRRTRGRDARGRPEADVDDGTRRP